MKKRMILTMVFGFGFCALARPQILPSFDGLRLRGIGADRASMDARTLQRRSELMVESQYYVVLRNKEAVGGADRIQVPTLERFFAASAKKHGVSKEAIQAVGYLESWGENAAKSPTGPVGIMQFTKKAAKDEGLWWEEKQKVQVSNGVDRKTKQPKFKTKTVTVVHDDRLDPEKSIDAAAARLARMVKILGREDLAIANHHCGPGRMRDLIVEYVKAVNPKEEVKRQDSDQLVAKYGITFSKIFFENSPNFRRGVFEKIEKFMKKDQCPTYFFRIQAAARLLDINRRNPTEFLRLAKEWENKTDDDVRAPNRIWAWLGPADLKYKDFGDLKAATNKELVTPPSHRDFGYKLRTTGDQPIAEKDLANQEFYLQDSPEAVGTLLYVAYETRRLEAKEFKQLDVTSLVRSLAYQKGLPESNARTSLPTHTTGQAFDVSFKKRGKQRQTLDFVLDDMRFAGMVDFFEESKASETFHVVPAPQYKDFFLRIYRAAMAMQPVSLPAPQPRRR